MFSRRKVPAYCAFVVIASFLTSQVANRHITTNHHITREGRLSPEIRLQLEAASWQTSSRIASPETQEETRMRVEAAYGNLPLSFEPNRGQTDPRVKFLSRTRHRTLWLTKDEAVLAVGRPRRNHLSANEEATAALQAYPATPAVLRMKFAGANSETTIEEEDRLPGIVNYFAGRPAQWRTKIPTYARVRYRRLYPGIDLVFYGNNRELEYDLVVSPGADPGQIRLAIAGARKIRIDHEGNVVLETSAGDVIQQKPRIYQRNGATLHQIAGDYVITGRHEIGFRLESYDPRSPLVIDPVLRFSTFLGGSNFDQGGGIGVDSHNSVVVTGQTCSPEFPVTIGTAPSVGCAIFITKLDFAGSHLLFSTTLTNGTPFFNSSPALSLDPDDNVYIAGSTPFPSFFPATPGAYQTAVSANVDAFVVKLNANGSSIIYSTFLGGTLPNSANGVAADADGNAYVTGSTLSANFPTTPGAFQRQCKLAPSSVFCESQPAFVVKLNSNGTRALFSTVLGGSKTQTGSGIALDSSGNAYVAGITTSTDFPTTAGSAQPVFGGGSGDAFVTKVSSSGSHLIFSTYLGGGAFDAASGVAVDASGNAYVTGSTSSTNFPVLKALQPSCALQPGVGCDNAFIAKLSPNVGKLLYSTFLGGGGDGLDLGQAIAVTKAGQAYVTGVTSSSFFPITTPAFQKVFRAGSIRRDGFITKVSSAGTLIYSSYLGVDVDVPVGVALDPDTNAYVAGGTIGDFPVTPGSFQQTLRGRQNAFVAKVVALCALNTANRTVTICSPGNSSTVKSPARIIAGTADVTPVKLTQIYLDGKKIFEQPLSAINVALPIAAGTHRLTVQGLDTDNVFFKKSISINVSPH